MDILGIVAFASIVIICYGIGVVVKATPLNNEYIPSVLIVSGAILGAVSYVLKIPKFPAEDIYTGIAIGIVSALTSTGINQLVKQSKQLIKK